MKGVDLNATCGVVPYKTPQYNVNGFAVTNLALKATKAINFNDKFSLPIFVQAIWNPRFGGRPFSIWRNFKAIK